MLKAYINDSWIPITNRQKYYIEYQYGGQQTLSFSLPVNEHLNKELQEEVQIEEDGENRFLIKKINRVGNYVDYTCELDMDEFKLDVYKSTNDLEKFQTKSLSQIITAILPNGWSVSNTNIRDIKRTIELEGATNYDVLFKCEEIFDIVFEINNLAKTIRVIDPEQFEYTGLYIHRDLNLKSYTMKGDSSTLITRLYCEGKDGLTFSSINGGKNYVENMSYKNKVLSAYWNDERYTVAENLLADGKKKLDILAVPSRSYLFNVIDLASLDERYDFLAIHLYLPIKVIVDENLSIMSRVIKYRKYIDNNEKSQNIVTLSNEPQTLKSVINNALGGDMKNPIKGNFLEQAQKESAAIIEEFATKGHRYETENETYFLDELPKEKAKYVMRQNLGGIAFSQNGWAGPYTTAWTIDGRFNADFITTGTLQAIKLVGNSIEGGNININNNFIVDKDGNMTSKGKNSRFTGLIEGSTLKSTGGYADTEISDGRIKFTYKSDGTTATLRANATMTPAGQTPMGNLTLDADFHAAGDIVSSKRISAMEFNTMSDKRLKCNFSKELDPSWIDDIVVYSFDYKNGLKNQIGIIAQEQLGKDSAKYFLTQNKEGFYSVAYANIHNALIKYCQQLKQRVDAQEDRIARLEKLLMKEDK